jgi:hypothetical protein
MTAAAASASTQANVAVVLILVIAFTTCVVLWVHERRWDRHDDELLEHVEHLALLAGRIQSLANFLDVEINDPVDDSPEAMAAEAYEVYPALAESDRADEPTDEFPAVPATQPDNIAIQVQSALIEARPSPVPRDLTAEFPHPVDSDERKAKNAADIEERLARFNFTGGRR